MRFYYLAFAALVLISSQSLMVAQVQRPQLDSTESFDIHSIYESLDNQSQGSVLVNTAWWNHHVSQSQRRDVQPISTDIHSLMYLAVKHSNQIRIAKQNPLILETAINENDSRFDWTRYLNSAWNDTSEPVSNSLTVGGNQSRFNDHVFQGAAGVKRLTRTGGQLDISQRFGWQDNNSNFFIPANQATGQFTISYSHPLLRGRGRAYNNSLVILASIEAEAAHEDFKSELQNHLLEVARAYWALYLERAYLAHQVKLYRKTQSIVSMIETRQQIDAQRTQYVTAASALESRRADLIRARTAVINAETRLRGLINAPELSRSDLAELVPVEFPSIAYAGYDLSTELSTALQNRPEAAAAIKQVKAASTRLGIAQHEILPMLNLVTQGYTSGLRGNSGFGRAFTDQFSTGAPSYSIGLQYEMPVGNRFARAGMTRRLIELRQLQAQYDLALTAIETEVDIAVRELNTAYREIGAKSRALNAAETEAHTLELRWSRFIDGNANSALNLESLLRAQERVTESEREYVSSLLTYNLAMINLKKATGTLLQTENVTISKAFDSQSGPDLIIDKLAPSESATPAGESIAIPAESLSYGAQQPSPIYLPNMNTNLHK